MGPREPSLQLLPVEPPGTGVNTREAPNLTAWPCLANPGAKYSGEGPAPLLPQNLGAPATSGGTNGPQQLACAKSCPSGGKTLPKRVPNSMELPFRKKRCPGLNCPGLEAPGSLRGPARALAPLGSKAPIAGALGPEWLLARNLGTQTCPGFLSCQHPTGMAQSRPSYTKSLAFPTGLIIFLKYTGFPLVWVFTPLLLSFTTTVLFGSIVDKNSKFML